MSISQLGFCAEYPSIPAADANSASLILAAPFNNTYNIRDVSSKIRGSGTNYTMLSQNGNFDASISRYYGTSFVGNAADSSTRRLYTFQALTSFGTGNFCIESYVYMTSFSSSQLALFFNHDGTNNGFQILLTGDTFGNPTRGVYFSGGAGGFVTHTASNILPLNTWFHLAVVRSGSTLRIYVNGTSSLAFGGSISATYSTVFVPLSILVGSSSVWNGTRLQDFRIYQGAAKYTNNFIPPGAMFT